MGKHTTLFTMATTAKKHGRDKDCESCAVSMRHAMEDLLTEQHKQYTASIATQMSLALTKHVEEHGHTTSVQNAAIDKLIYRLENEDKSWQRLPAKIAYYVAIITTLTCVGTFLKMFLFK